MTHCNGSGTFINNILAQLTCCSGVDKPSMTITKKSIAIIAPESLLSAFCIFFASVPNIELLAAELSVAALQNKAGKKPDIVLVYLTKESYFTRRESVPAQVIKELKHIWPDVYIIVVVSSSQQRALAQTMGADEILFEGIKPARLLAVIDKVETAQE